MNMKMRVVLIFLMLIIVCFSFARGEGEAPKEETIKIGALFPLTGDLARFGVDSFEGAELARIVQNEKGGLFGKQIVFAKGDATTPKIGMTEAERLYTSQKVDLILGTYSSSLGYVCSEVGEKYKKIYWEQGATSDTITNRGFKYLFRLCPRSSDYAKATVDSVVGTVCESLGIKKENVRISGIWEDSEMGTNREIAVKAELAKYGLELIFSDFYSSKDLDLSSMIMRLKKAEPDVVIGTNYLVDFILYWRQAKEFDLNVPAFFDLGGGTALSDFIDAVGVKDADGAIGVSFCPPPDAVNPEYAPGVEEFMEKYEQVFGPKKPSIYTAINYAHTTVLWEVLKKAGSLNADAVIKAAMDLDIPDNTTITGYGYKFDATHQNIRAKIITQQWQDGKLWAVVPAEAALPGRGLKLPMKTWEEKAKLEIKK